MCCCGCEVVCGTQVLLCAGECGERLSSLNAYEMLKAVKHALQQLGFPQWDKISLKTFRVGKATHMASSGESLATILMFGEWRSSAVLRYISETEVDKERFLQRAFIEDAVEEEEVA